MRKQSKINNRNGKNFSHYKNFNKIKNNLKEIKNLDIIKKKINQKNITSQRISHTINIKINIYIIKKTIRKSKCNIKKNCQQKYKFIKI